MKKLNVLSLLVLVAIVAMACGGGVRGTRIGWSTEPMPDGGDFDGVFHSAFGRMEFTVQGTQLVGLYEGDQHHGRIEGNVDGNLMHFTWTQWNQDMQGKLRETKGHGVFRYYLEEVKMGDDVEYDHKLEGVWGYGTNETGNSWEAYKLRNAKKNLKAFKPELSEMQRGAKYDGGSVGFDAVDGSEKRLDNGSSPSKPADESDEPEGDDVIDDIF